MSHPAQDFHLRRSPNLKSTLLILLRWEFAFATEIAFGSTSMPTTRPAPKRFAARARIPLPVPRSASDQLFFHSRVKRSRRRRDIAVVACSPAPNAAEAGITSKGRPRACDCTAAVILSRGDDEGPLAW